MNFEFLRVAAAVLGTGLAAVQDGLTSFIDDRITLSMITAGAILTFASFDLNYSWQVILPAALIGVFGYLLYRTGQLGGGDVLLFVALQLLLPEAPSFSKIHLSFISIPFFFSIITASFFFAMIGTALLFAWKLRKLKPKPNWQNLLFGIAFAAVFAYLTSFIMPLPPLQAIFYALIFAPGLFLLSFREQIMHDIIIQKISIKEIEDEDILATEEIPELVKKHSLERVLTKSQVEKLKEIEKKEKVHKFPVYKNLPRLGPYIILGLLASLYFGDFFAFVLLS
jgi:Flp pilus assembly protein protease CpaA